MRSSRTLATLGLGTAALAAFALVGAASASADSQSLYTVYAASDAETNDVVSQSFATISATDAGVTPFGTVDPTVPVVATEIYAGTGYGISENDGGGPSVLTWNISTGAASSPVAIQKDPATEIAPPITRVIGLDTTVNSPDLPDGTLLTIAQFGDDVPLGSQEATAPRAAESQEANADVVQAQYWLGTLDATTGYFFALVNLSAAVFGGDAQGYLDSIATDPTTGTTYVLFDYDNGTPLYLTADFAGHTWDGPTPLPNVEDALGGGFMEGADFDASGTLWFIYDQFSKGEMAQVVPIIGDGNPLASTTGAFGTDVGASAIGGVPDSETDQIAEFALTVGPAYTPPALAKTGFPMAGFAGAAGMLLLVGAAGVFVTRRRVAL